MSQTLLVDASEYQKLFLEVGKAEQRAADLQSENARLRAENAEIAAVKTRELLPFTSAHMDAVEAERDALAMRCMELEAQRSWVHAVACGEEQIADSDTEALRMIFEALDAAIKGAK